MRAMLNNTLMILSICALLGNSQVFAFDDTSQEPQSKSETHSQKHSSKKNQMKSKASSAEAKAAKIAKQKQKAAAQAEKKAKNLAKQAAEKMRKEQPRSSYTIKVRESLNEGLVVVSTYKIRNVKVAASGIATAQLEIRDSADNVLVSEECSASAELPTDIRTDRYRLSCRISEKQRFNASLRAYNVAPGTYSGTARNTTDIPDVELYPVGFGAVNLSVQVVVPPSTDENVDCVLSEWGAFSACEDGLRTRNRSILVEPQGEGLECGALTESQFCF